MPGDAPSIQLIPDVGDRSWAATENSISRYGDAVLCEIPAYEGLARRFELLHTGEQIGRPG
jgi:hypothetical protein